METCFNWCEPGWCYFSSDEAIWINRLRKLAEAHPGECVIERQPETNCGIIYGRFPAKWLRVKPPVQLELTDEERAKRAENLRKISEQRRTKANAEAED